ncbi:hypothetical protein HDV63DRAFT_280137 [Trichoderma sp. SZMC 28014]
MDIEDTIDGSHPYSITLCATSLRCVCLSQPFGNPLMSRADATTRICKNRNTTFHLQQKASIPFPSPNVAVKTRNPSPKLVSHKSPTHQKKKKLPPTRIC